MAEEKVAAEQEGTHRLMSFAMGINRRAEEAGITYSDLAKAANIADEMLAPSLAQVVAKAAEELAKSDKKDEK